MPNMVNETQDRPSIISKSGFPNVNDITGLTRGGDVNDMMQHEEGGPDPSGNYPRGGGEPLPPGGASAAGAVGHLAAHNGQYVALHHQNEALVNSRGVSPGLGLSAELASSSDVSHYNPDFMVRNTRDNTRTRI